MCDGDCGCAGITPTVYRDQIPDDVFLVIQKRRDDTQPKAYKTLGLTWYASPQEAKEFAEKMNERDGGEHYAAYRAHLIVLDPV